MRHLVFISLVALMLLASGCGNDARVQLVQVDSEREANRIMVVLAQAQIPHAGIVRTTEQRKAVFKVVVESANLDRARAILVENDLPRPEGAGFEKMLSSTGLIPTAADERARLMFATASELERTLEVYDSVVAARVHIVLPNDDTMYVEKTKHPSATVLIKLKPGASDPTTQPSATLNDKSVSELVAGAVADLKTDDVKVKWTIASDRRSGIPAVTVVEEPSSNRPEPTVITLCAVIALLLVALSAVTFQLLRANRRSGRPRGRMSLEGLTTR